jgi:ABC-type multidrug transport system fused ATPase/permease subunit
MACLSFVKAYVQGWLHNMIILQLRKELYAHLLKLPISFFSEMPTGKVSQRLFDDIDTVAGTIVGGIISSCVEVAKLAIVFIILCFLGFKFLFLFAVVSLLYYLNFSYFKGPIENTSRDIGKKVGDLYSRMFDAVPGIREVKNFSMERTENRFFIEEHCNLFRLKMKNFIIFNVMQGLAELIVLTATGLSFIFSVNEFRSGRLSVGGIVMLMSYLHMMRGPVEALIGVITSFKQGAPSIERIEEISNQNTEDHLNGITLNIKQFTKFCTPTISFKDVDFSYPNSPSTLMDINLDIPAGTSIALVGHTGAGKTTLVSLLLRYYLPDSGEIKIDNTNINNLKVSDLRRSIAVVPQHPHVFYTSIANNIIYGDQKTRLEDVIQICKEINFHDFIMSLPNKYDSVIGERGVKLSGGQRQLLAIARAMLKNLPILVLDEATAHLDSKSESIIQSALKKLIRNRTTIVIAHRLSTIISSDKIVVMTKGRIQEVGKHEDLLQREGAYAKLYREQFKPEYLNVKN